MQHLIFDCVLDVRCRLVHASNLPCASDFFSIFTHAISVARKKKKIESWHFQISRRPLFLLFDDSILAKDPIIRLSALSIELIRPDLH